MKIVNPQQVRQYYQDKDVAEKYITRRFKEPLNCWEHQKQARIINQIIKASQAKKVLEFASGPARITTEIELEGGTSIDASREMLRLARKRMKEKGRSWIFLQGDLLNLEENKKNKKLKKLRKNFDLIFSLRFFLHFKLKEREKLYRQARQRLKEGGYLAFEVMNKEIVLPLRKLLGREKYFVYDKLYTKNEFVAEMEANGFQVVKLYPILNHFWLQAFLSRPLKLLGGRKKAVGIIAWLERFTSKNPYEWIALCRKN